MVWVVSGDVCHFVTVLVFVRGSKWVSVMLGRVAVEVEFWEGEGEREERDSKSERSNQSLLLVLELGGVEMWEVRWICKCHLWKGLPLTGGRNWRWGDGAGVEAGDAMELRNTAPDVMWN